MGVRAGDPIRYFAYGSNMLTRRLVRRAPSATPVAPARLHHRRLTFEKVSVDGSGKCTIIPASEGDDIVHGVLYEIAASDKLELDRAEELGRGYREARVDVVTPTGVRAAVTYVALVTDPDLAPYCWYKAFVVAGAEEHGLPDRYVEALREVRCVPDGDLVRRARNEAILAEDRR